MLDNLSALMSVTLGGSVCILLFLAAGPLLSKQFTPRWRYCAWGVLAAVLLLFPVLRPLLPGTGERSALLQIPVPQAVEERTAPEYDGMAADEADALPYGYQGTMVGGFRGDTTYEVWYTDDEQVEHHLYDFKLFRLEGISGSWSILFRWERIWAAGLAVSLFLLVAECLRMWGRVRRRKLPLIHGSVEKMSELCAQEKVERLPRLFRVSGLKSPCLVGIVRPAILLPRELPAEALSWALAHELTHLKHRDTWYMLLMTLARCVHWFNPLVWLMVRTARRDMELCCDYDLLNGQGEEARRAYGRAILDQIAGRDRGCSGLTTGFSGSKREVFARFRAMMDSTPKRKGGVVLVLAGAAVLLSGSLVGCQRLEEEPKTGASEAFTVQYAWVENIDRDNRSVTYIPMTLEQWEDREGFWAQMGGLERETASLTEDVSLYHTYNGNRYPLNPTAQVYTLDMSQAGLPGQLVLVETGEDAGAVSGIWLDAQSRLDLTAAGLDFAGYCGEVYAAGMGGAMLLHGVAGISVDPCDELGQDSDHTRYTLPLAEDAQISATDMPFLTGLSSALYPDLFQLTVVNGEVTAIEGVWPEAENTVTLPIDPEEETPSNPENMPEHDPDFYGENGAEDMPEYDPGFYGESGAQPLEPDGSGTA